MRQFLHQTKPEIAAGRSHQATANQTIGGQIEPVLSQLIQAKPMFRGLSQELSSPAQGGVTPMKLATEPSADCNEQEADRVAERVVNQIGTPQVPSLTTSSTGAQQPSSLARADLAQSLVSPIKLGSAISSGIAVSPTFKRSLQQARSGGQPLAKTIRQPMERAFRKDFSHVKIHTNLESNRLNQAIPAHAFTTGQDIFFRQGAYAPESRQGQMLIAHELSHVVQQNYYDAQPAPTIQCQLDQQQLLATLSGSKGPALKTAVKNLIAQLEIQGLQAHAPNASRHSPEVVAQLTGFKDELSRLAEFQTYSSDWKTEFIQDLTSYITLYNQTEADLQQAEQANKPRYDLESLVKVGTEFTFTNETIEKLVVGQASQVLEDGEDFISKWANKISKYNNQAVEKVTPPREGNLTPKSPKAVQFIYRLMNGNTWWWALDLDEGCLETQTQPMTYKEAAGEVQAIIDDHIFGLAEDLGLRTDEEIGGGHLTLDGTTAFQGDARILRNFLVLYHTNNEKWSKYDTDASNAPMMHEVSKATRQKFKEIVDEVETKITNPRMIGKKGQQQPEPAMTEETLVTKLKDMYKTTEAWAEKWDKPISQLQGLDKDKKDQQGNPLDPVLNQAQDIRDHRTHYQATNIENMDKGANRRIEMRRFAAQKSGDELLEQLQELLDLIFESGKAGIRPLPSTFVSKGRK